ncbi:DNA repair protein rhp42 [Pleurostoma richardsiae]|uniref:DNA repair protein rhp42 n=1 Tax=Pleurostoma richardsiae TaxID=41990 RepID=A0AA38R698_9PEZI|nr:DNA repair protein rhp42 [Pleurostoma richardsiae]
MPPHVPRKRSRGEQGARDDEPPKKKGRAVVTAPPRKATLFDDLDASATPRSSARTSHVHELHDSSSDEDSSLTSLSDGDFEDVPGASRLVGNENGREKDDDDEDEEDEDIEFEDVPSAYVPPTEAPVISGDLTITLSRDTGINFDELLADKKGPSKQDRQRRIASHCLHVECLLWHNAIRNSWLCDPEVQGILLSYLPPSLWAEVDLWRQKSGLEVPKEAPKKTNKGKAPSRGRKSKPAERSDRDWGDAAQRLEKGAVDMSHGDPLFRLVKVLAAWWKKRFQITAPGIRKLGYMPLERLSRLVRGYKTDEHNPEVYGERIRNLEEFRLRAQECSGSRDLGAQLFTALLRALGLEARMVASLQPVGFGWAKPEEAEPEKVKNTSVDHSPASIMEAASRDGVKTKDKSTPSKSRRTSRQVSKKEIHEDADESDYYQLLDDHSDDDVIELPPLPTKSKVFDKDLEYPHYWTEVLSPVTKKYLAVDAIAKSIIATNRELVETFEPRGGKADKAKQIIAYVIGYSQDGTAKDVTVRYLKRQMLPGRTKGMRFPIEKVPVYNKNGKIKRYDQFDWFKSVMRGYTRGSRKHPITEVDEEEEATDLKPAQPQKKEVKEGEETLQYYKQSAEFVLERHLKREEALLRTAKPVKVFKSKAKGDKIVEENVYLRKDVVQVKSAETWHKQGRAPIPGEEPLKKAPYRAATTNRRREIAEAEAATGQKVLQGLYSYNQTEWIIPPPIQNGIIPKNEYGNIDLFVDHMCPEGAVHVPFRGAMRVCKRLGIDYAEAVVDFEFGHRMAVPVIQGVVIAEEYHDQVMEEVAKDEAERARKEDEKRRKAALAMWRKLLMGMRIVERIRRDHGHIKDDFEAFGHSQKDNRDALSSDNRGDGEDMAGGFLPEGYEEEGDKEPHQTSSFFPVVEDDAEEEDGDDALMMDDGDGGAARVDTPEARDLSPPGAMSGTESRDKAKGPARRRRRKAPSPSGDDSEFSDG